MINVFNGISLFEIYKDISRLYPNGVEFVSTTIDVDGQNSNYTVVIEDGSIATDSFKRLKGKLLSKEIDYDWLESISTNMISNGFFKDDIQSDNRLAINYMIDEIESNILIANEKTYCYPKIIMMVGTTGVGKTTTIAKLASRYQLELDNDVDISFINLDHYRVASSEQLKMYANISGATFEDIYDFEAFNDKLQSISENSIVFVDTAGVAPTDISKILETITYLNSIKNIDIDVSLVLPATFKKEDLHYAYNYFSFLNLTSLIITKFDETSSVTGLVDFLRTCPVKLDYFSIGQKVPDDIIDASSEYIIDKLRSEWLAIDEK